MKGFEAAIACEHCGTLRHAAKRESSDSQEMAADLAAAIKRCKLSPEAGAAELRKALEETEELASAADAAAAAAASLKSGSATARGHALAACILLAG